MTTGQVNEFNCESKVLLVQVNRLLTIIIPLQQTTPLTRGVQSKRARDLVRGITRDHFTIASM